jgi:hypothetical protein
MNVNSQNIPSLVPYRWRDYFGFHSTVENKWVVEPQYVGATPFVNNYCKVYDFANEYILDASLNIVQVFPSLEFGKVGHFNKNGVAKFTDMFRRRGYGFVSLQKEILLEKSYNAMWQLSDDVYCAEDFSGKYGVLSTTSGKIEVVVPFEYEDIIGLGNDLYSVCKEGKYYFLNRHGEKVSNQEYYEIGSFSESACWLSTGLMIGAVIDQLGNVLFTHEYKKRYLRIYPFKHGLARVKVMSYTGEYSFGYLNMQGEMVVNAVFQNARDFSEGMAAVQMGNGKWGFINTLGELIIDAKYESCSDFKGNLAQVDVGVIPGYRSAFTTGYIGYTGIEFFEN